MKTKRILLMALLSTALMGSIFVGCKKASNKPKQDSDTASSVDNAEASYISDDASNIADAAAKGQTSFKMATPDNNYLKALSSCATVTINDSVSPHVITVDFGPTDCTCNDGRNRRGQIIATYSGGYFDSLSTHTITFNNYYINDNHVEGSKTVTNNGHNSQGYLTWTVTVNNLKITHPDGKYHTWSANRTREMIAGESTPINWLDDVYLLTGTQTGTNINGLSYTCTVTSPLKIALSCHYIESGTVDVTPSGKPTRTLDFGNGTCDNIATVTISGYTYTIYMN